MRRRTTPAGRLARLGFADAARAERLLSEDLALDAEGADADLLAALAAAADPDLALVTLARMPRDAELAEAMRADAGLRNRLTAVLGASAALGDYLVRHPADWHVLSGPDALRGGTAAEARAALLAAVGARPDDPAAGGRPGRRPGRQPGHRAARRLPAAAAPAGRARPDRRGHRGRDRRRTGRPGRRRAGGGAGHRPVGTAGRRRARPARGDRHGQVRRPRAELRQRRRRDLRGGASPGDDPRSACPGDYPRNPRPPIATPRRRGGRARDRDGRAAHRDPAGRRDDPGLLTEHPGGRAVPRRPQPAPGGPGWPAGPHAGQPPRLLRAMGQDVGVPGAAEGPAGRR